MGFQGLIGSVICLAGAMFLFLGALGILRMPDLYNRLQAGTKATTLGTILSLGGLAILVPSYAPKLVLILLFVLLTNPLSSHALARAVHRAGARMPQPDAPDALRDAMSKEAQP